MSDHQENNDTENESPWQTLLFGVVMLGVAVYLYITLTKFEAEGGEITLNRIVAIAYKMGGKWPVTIICALLGAFSTYSGVRKMMGK